MTFYRQAAALMALAGIALAQPAAAAPAQVTPVAPPGAPVYPQATHAAATPFVDDPARVAVEQFLLRQSNGLPGKVSVQVVPPSGGRAPECVNPEPFLPAGAAPYGRVNVGVRCGGDRPWTRYVQARVSVLTDYYVAARAMGPGETITAADLEMRQGDLGALPRAVVTDPAQVEGSVAANRIAAGSPLRTDLLRRPIAVKSGQTVNVTVEGDSFQLTSEGKVLSDAATGNAVQVRLRNGQVVSGLVRSGDTVVLQQ
ncbi:flagellar basal body P-ring formation chaperone FlgA [Cupriavidus pauculus]|jgi:flagella basal body P-ring formation protein FlgA|uniref:flagellar basal body P-ring formation chaperone FlgA n=1 Tax=Cupriavidus pauculus TaxID=82633 RepID=UPI0030F7860D